jgi:hypothetical protein
MIIPINARNEFRMVLFDKLGREYKEHLTNSDLVYFNEFFEKLKIKEYTYSKK